MTRQQCDYDKVGVFADVGWFLVEKVLSSCSFFFTSWLESNDYDDVGFLLMSGAFW